MVFRQFTSNLVVIIYFNIHEFTVGFVFAMFLKSKSDCLHFYLSICFKSFLLSDLPSSFIFFFSVCDMLPFCPPGFFVSLIISLFLYMVNIFLLSPQIYPDHSHLVSWRDCKQHQIAEKVFFFFSIVQTCFQGLLGLARCSYWKALWALSNSEDYFLSQFRQISFPYSDKSMCASKQGR